MQEHAVLGEQRVQAGEVAGRRLDVQGGAAGVRDQVVGRRGAQAGLEHLEGFGDRAAVEHGAQQHVVGQPGLADVRVGHQGVGDQAEAGGVHPGLGQQAGLDHGDEVRAVVLADLQHDQRLRGVQEPVPVLPDDRRAVLAGAGTTANALHSAGAASLMRWRLPGLGRVHHLGAHVDRQHVGQVEAGAVRDAAHLVEVRGPELADRRLEPERLAPDGGPVPPREVREGLLVGLDRQPHPGRGLAAVLAAALVAGALDAHVLGAGHPRSPGSVRSGLR